VTQGVSRPYRAATPVTHDRAATQRCPVVAVPKASRKGRTTRTLALGNTMCRRCLLFPVLQELSQASRCRHVTIPRLSRPKSTDPGTASLAFAGGCSRANHGNDSCWVVRPTISTPGSTRSHLLSFIGLSSDVARLQRMAGFPAMFRIPDYPVHAPRPPASALAPHRRSWTPTPDHQTDTSGLSRRAQRHVHHRQQEPRHDLILDIHAMAQMGDLRHREGDRVSRAEWDAMMLRLSIAMVGNETDRAGRCGNSPNADHVPRSIDRQVCRCCANYFAEPVAK